MMNKRNDDREKNNKRVWKRMAAVLLIAMLVTGLLAGCSSGSSETEDTDGQAPREIKAAVIGTTNGYAYVDEDGQLIGYNVDVLNAVFDQLPQYTLTFETTEFQSIFTGIDSGIYQIGAQAFISSAERREKYIFTEAFGKYIFKIITSADDTSIQSWKDLGDKTTEALVGDGPVAIIESYNQDYPDAPIQLDYVETADQVMNHVIDGKVDFYISSSTVELLRAQEFGVTDQLRFLDFGDDAPAYFASNQYFGFLISKTEEALAEDFNTVLEQLIADGTIDALNEKWFGSSEYSITIEEASAFRDAEE